MQGTLIDCQAVGQISRRLDNDNRRIGRGKHQMTICADGDRRDASKEDADDMTSKILVPSSAVVDAEGSITPKQNEWEQGNHAMVPENTPQTSSQQESEEMTPTATNELRPKVGFSVLTLREYPIVLGDNPGKFALLSLDVMTYPTSSNTPVYHNAT